MPDGPGLALGHVGTAAKMQNDGNKTRSAFDDLQKN